MLTRVSLTRVNRELGWVENEVENGREGTPIPNFIRTREKNATLLPSFLLFSLSFHSSIEQLDYEMEMRDGGSNEPHRVKFPKITNI